MKLRKKAREKSKSYDITLSRMSWLGSHSRLAPIHKKACYYISNIYTQFLHTVQFFYYHISFTIGNMTDPQVAFCKRRSRV